MQQCPTCQGEYVYIVPQSPQLNKPIKSNTAITTWYSKIANAYTFIGSRTKVNRDI